MNQKRDNSFYKKGQAALIGVMFFLFISLVVLGAFGYIGQTQISLANDLVRAKESYVTAESAIEDAVFRVAHAMEPTTFGAAEDTSVILNSGTAGVDITDSGGGVYSLLSTGDIGGRYRKVQATAEVSPLAPGFLLPSAVQAGFLGVRFNDRGSVRHSLHPTPPTPAEVFSNGTVDGDQGSYDMVKGNIFVAEAIAASTTYSQHNLGCTDVPPRSTSYGFTGSLPTLPLSNPPSPETPCPTLSNIYEARIHADANTYDGAQAFIAPITAYVSRMKVLIKRSATGSFPDISVAIVPNSQINSVNGAPYTFNDSKRLASGAINSASVTTSYSWVEVTFSTSGSNVLPAIEGEKYWIVFDVSGTDTTKIYSFIATPNTEYTTGQAVGVGIPEFAPCYGLICDSTADGDGNYGPAAFKYSTNASAATPVYTMPTALATKRIYNSAGVAQNVDVDIGFQVFFGEDTQDSSSRYVTQARSVEAQDISGTDGIIQAQQIAAASYAKKSSTTGQMRYRTLGTDIYSADNLPPVSPVPSNQNCAGTQVAPWCTQMSSGFPRPRPYDNSADLPPRQLFKQWKDDARHAGTTAGNLTITSGQVLGYPQKYTGNFNINTDGELLLKAGTTTPAKYVMHFQGTGTIDTSQSSHQCRIYLDADPDAGVSAFLIFDGSVNINGHCRIIPCRNDTCEGQNETNNKIFILSLDSAFKGGSEPRIAVGGPQYDKGSIWAPFGEVRVSENPILERLMAAGLRIWDNAQVVYKGGGASCPSCTEDVGLSFTEFHEVP